jgi:hypothetical protein
MIYIYVYIYILFVIYMYIVHVIYTCVFHKFFMSKAQHGLLGSVSIARSPRVPCAPWRGACGAAFPSSGRSSVFGAWDGWDGWFRGSPGSPCGLGCENTRIVASKSSNKWGLTQNQWRSLPTCFFQHDFWGTDPGKQWFNNQHNRCCCLTWKQQGFAINKLLFNQLIDQHGCAVRICWWLNG